MVHCHPLPSCIHWMNFVLPCPVMGRFLPSSPPPPPLHFAPNFPQADAERSQTVQLLGSLWARGCGLDPAAALPLLSAPSRLHGEASRLCHAMPCFAMSCFAMPCQAMPCLAHRICLFHVTRPYNACASCLPRVNQQLVGMYGHKTTRGHNIIHRT